MGNNEHGESGLGDCNPRNKIEQLLFFENLKLKIKKINATYGATFFLTGIYYFFSKKKFKFKNLKIKKKKILN
jgi:hypothetical protein